MEIGFNKTTKRKEGKRKKIYSASHVTPKEKRSPTQNPIDFQKGSN